MIPLTASSWHGNQKERFSHVATGLSSRLNGILHISCSIQPATFFCRQPLASPSLWPTTLKQVVDVLGACDLDRAGSHRRGAPSGTEAGLDSRQVFFIFDHPSEPLMLALCALFSTLSSFTDVCLPDDAPWCCRRAIPFASSESDVDLL